MESEPTIKQRYSSRKFWTMIFCLALFSSLVILEKIEGSVYEGLIWVTLGGYFAANVGEKFSRRS